MGKRGGGTFGRRPTIQIATEVPKHSNFGFGYNPESSSQQNTAGGSQALGGLLAQYGAGSDNESEHEDEIMDTHSYLPKGTVVPMQPFVAASHPDLPPPPPPPQHEDKVAHNGDFKPKSILKTKVTKSILKAPRREVSPTPQVSGSGEPSVSTNQPPKPFNEADEKLKDFLAEIDALENTGAVSSSSSNQPQSSTSEASKYDELDGQPLVSSTAKNDDELGGDEYEEVTDDEANKDMPPRPVKPEEPVTLWQHCLDEETQYYYYWNQQSNEVTWEIPQSYSQYLLQVKEYENKMAKYKKDIAEWEVLMKSHPKRTKKVLKRKIRPIPALQQQQTHAPSTSTLNLPQTPPPPPPESSRKHHDDAHNLVSTSTNEENSETIVTDHSRAVSKLLAEGKKKDKGKRSKKSKRSHKSEDGEEEPLVQGPSLPLIGPQIPTPGENSQQEAKQTEKSEVNTESTSVAQIAEIDDDNDDDFIHQQLEEPVFTHYEYVNKKYQSSPVAPNSAASGSKKIKGEIEDIDKELELAFERRKNKVEKFKMSEKSAKRLPTAPLHPPMDAKKMKILSDDKELLLGRLSKSDIKSKVDSLAEASELANVVMDKLEFLEINRTGISPLQVLLLQLETRIEDWKNGGLNTEYLLVKLRHADSELQKQEEQASPLGWSCHWDRASKKYFYWNDVTGESQWEYPDTGYAADDDPTPDVCDNKQPIDEKDVDVSNQPGEMHDDIEQNEEATLVEKTGSRDPLKSSPNFSQLAHAPPPPPNEPPPPGTESPDSADTLKAINQSLAKKRQHKESETSDSTQDSDSSEEERKLRKRFRSASRSKSRSDSTASSSSESSRSRSRSVSRSPVRRRPKSKKKHRRKRKHRRHHSRKQERREDVESPVEADDDNIDSDDSTKKYMKYMDEVEAEADVKSRKEDDKEDENECEAEKITMPELPVHKKPVHIAAQPVLNKPAPITPADSNISPEDNEAAVASSDNHLHKAEADGNAGENDSVAGTSGVGIHADKTSSVGDKDDVGDLEAVAHSTKSHRKKKKEKSLSGGGLSLKKKGLSSMVDKWKKVAEDVEMEKKREKKKRRKHLDEEEEGED